MTCNAVYATAQFCPSVVHLSDTRMIGVEMAKDYVFHDHPTCCNATWYLYHSIVFLRRTWQQNSNGDTSQRWL